MPIKKEEDPVRQFILAKGNEIAQYLREHTNLVAPEVTITWGDGLKKDAD